MSSEDQAEKPVTPTKSYKLTRGGAYLIEGLLQRTEFTPTIPTTKRAARLRRKIRAQNPCKSSTGRDFEKPVVRNGKETEPEWQQRAIDNNEEYEEWSKGDVTLELTDKDRDFLVNKALKWAFGARDKVFVTNNEHVLSIIECFDLEDDGE